MKLISFKIIALTLIGFAIIAGLWTCSQEKYSENSICMYSKQLQESYTLYKEGSDFHYMENVKEKSFKCMDQTINYCYQIIEPYAIKMKAGYQWSGKTNVKTALKQLGNVLRSLLYTTNNQLRPFKFLHKLYTTYLLSSWSWFKEVANLQCKKWLFQLEGYVNRPSKKPKTQQDNINLSEDSIVEDQLKKTAKRILNYIDQLNQESIKTGMKQEEAKEKAQEIIKSITDSTVQRNEEVVSELGSADSDAGIVAFEIQSIMETALQERLRLENQLDLILSHIQSLNLEEELNEDTDLFISALKTEIDQLRAAAENSVRKRTKMGLQHVEEIKSNTLVIAHMKGDLQAAQRAALKELRQIYVKLYKTNEEIDKIMHL